MPKGIIYWVLMCLWLVLGLCGWYWPGTPFLLGGGALLLFILLLLLGWQVFGPPIQ